MKTALETALTANSVTLRVYEFDRPEDTDRMDLPCAAVTYAGTEFEVGGTNIRDDFAFPLLVGLYTPDGGSADPPGCPLVLFRQIVRQTFNNKRLPGVVDVYQCGYDGQPPVIDDPIFANLRTAALVVPVARLPRG